MEFPEYNESRGLAAWAADASFIAMDGTGVNETRPTAR